MLGLVFESVLAASESLLQFTDGIVQIVRAVVDRRVAEGNVALIPYGYLGVGLRGETA